MMHAVRLVRRCMGTLISINFLRYCVLSPHRQYMFVTVLNLSFPMWQLMGKTFQLSSCNQFTFEIFLADKLVTYSTTLPSGTFETDSDHSYSCISDEFFKIDANSNVTFSDVRVQALGVAQSGFSPGKMTFGRVFLIYVQTPPFCHGGA